jgi:hypothetical protein
MVEKERRKVEVWRCIGSHTYVCSMSKNKYTECAVHVRFKNVFFENTVHKLCSNFFRLLLYSTKTLYKLPPTAIQ